MAVVTIARDYASDSERVASLLAERLGWDYIGKNLVARVARELRISRSDVETFLKHSRSRLLRFVDRYTCSLVQKVVDREYGCLDDDNYFKVTKKLVENVYETGDAVILGWGSQCILQGRPNVLHLRLVKGEEEKISTVMARYNLDRDRARRLIASEEEDRRRYIKHYFDRDWDDARLYDLVIDMGKTGVEEAVETVINHLQPKRSQPPA